MLTIHDHETAGLDDLTDGIRIEADEPDPACGGGSHLYRAYARDGELVATIQFQHGPRGEYGSRQGVTAQAVLAMLVHHIKSFQAERFACRENALAITALEEARGWMLLRAIDRKRRGVLGKLER